MSGYIGLTPPSGVNPAISAYQQGADFEDQQQKQQRALGVDAAVRAGVNDMLGPQQPSADPNATTSAPSYQTPPAAPAAASAGSAPPGTASTGAAAANLESGGNPAAVNAGGYSGKYQFGKGALADAGVYQPAEGESLAAADNAKPWAGTFNVPGMGAMSYQQFMGSEAAQDAAWQAHVQQMDKEIANRGLSSYYGQTIAGVPINEDTVRGMIQGGGAAGTQSFITSRGSYNPADSNGTRISDFGMRIGGASVPGAPPGVRPGLPSDPNAAPPVAGPSGADVLPASATYLTPPAAPGAAPGTAFMPGYNTSRYDPILRQLAQVPGGGAASLSLLENQGKFDQANYRRTDTYQRLAMSALAHGDTTTARFYAEAGGLQIPDNVFSNSNNAMMLGRAGTLAEKFYKNDPDQAHVFATSYLQTGDASQAFNAAGVPRHQPNTTLAWVQQADGQLKAMGVNAGNGTATPITGPDNQPLTAAPKPMAQQLTWVQQADGSQLGYTRNPQDGSLTPTLGPDGQQIKAAPKPVAGVATFNNKVAMMEGTGMSHADAVAAATGQAIKPANVIGAYTRLRSSLDGSIDGIGMSEPDKQARVASTMDTMFGPGRWQPLMGQVAAPTAGMSQGAAPGPSVTVPAAPAGGSPNTPPTAGYQAPRTVAPSIPGTPPAPPPTPQTATALPSGMAAAPGVNGPMAAPTSQDIATATANAKNAIAKGAPRAAVLQRLQQLGIPIPADL